MACLHSEPLTESVVGMEPRGYCGVTHERQLGSKQDYAVNGMVGELVYIGVMDGHGNGVNKNKCINLLRSYNFDEIAASDDPVEIIASKLQPHDLRASGSTFTFARINKPEREIEVFNVGDSKTVVIINGKIVYTTPEHTFHNAAEVERTKDFVHSIAPTMAPFPVNEHDIHMIRSDVGLFRNGDFLVPSQSLGHDNVTGLAPSVEKISYAKTDVVRVICGSDGFWDMYMEQYEQLSCDTPEGLIQLAEDRWKQQWNFYDGKKAPVVTNFGNQFDDIAIAVWDYVEIV